MMKVLLALLFSSALMAESYIVVSGFAWHGKDANKNGRVYDRFIEGIGYQYRVPRESLDYTFTTLVISDSNANTMYTGTLGVAYHIVYNINIGVEAGVGSRRIYAVDDNGHKLDYRVRSIVPVILPKTEIDFGPIIMNISYIPKIEALSVPEFLYINFGIKL